MSGPHETAPASFAERQAAEDEVRRRLVGDVLLTDADGAFGGCIIWATEQAPAELFDELVDDYGSEPHDPLCGLAQWALDRTQDFLLIEENVHGGYWLSSHRTADDAARYHHEQEYAADWTVTELVNHRTGERSDVIAGPAYARLAEPPAQTAP